MSSAHWVTLGDICREHARRFPLRIAAIDGDRRCTYPELDVRVTRLSNALRTHDIGPGSRILWLGQNSVRVLELLLAAGKVGFVLCPANWRLTAAELEHVVESFSPSVVFWQEAEIGSKVAEVRERAGRDAIWIQHDADTSDSYEALLSSGSADDVETALSPELPCLAVYTAAFGGTPRAALLSHAGFIHTSLMYGYLLGVNADTVFLNSTPWFHVGVLRWALSTFVLGGTNVFVPRVDANQLCRLIATERITDADLLPVTQQQMIDANADGQFDLTSLRSPVGSDAWNAMVGIEFPTARVTGWGQTEVTGLATATTLGGAAIGLHGRSMPFALVRILDENGHELPVGQVGEIVVRGPTLMIGYLDEDHVVPDVPERRWHRSNDLGRREADGSITFIGPKTRMVKSGLENIYPVEIENCLRAHADVVDAAVIGIPDLTFVQVPKAIVVVRESQPALRGEDLEVFLRKRLAGYKVPKTYAFVAELPRVNGQVDYASLDLAHGGGGYPGGGTPTR